MECRAVLAGEAAVSAVEVAGQLALATSAQDVSELFQRYVAAYGFVGAACFRMPILGIERAPRLLMTTLPAPLTLELQRRLELRPVERAAARSGIYQALRCRSGGTEPCLEGMVVPVFACGSCSGLVVVLGTDAEPEITKALAVVALTLYNRLNGLDGPMPERGPELSGREGACLIWAATGKSDWAIGRILGISGKTVNFHVENAKRKLAVSTRIQTAHAASYLQGLSLAAAPEPTG